MGHQVAQLVEHPTLDFGSGHDPGVVGPSIGLCAECGACFSFSLSFCSSPPFMRSLFKKKNLEVVNH